MDATDAVLFSEEQFTVVHKRSWLEILILKGKNRPFWIVDLHFFFY